MNVVLLYGGNSLESDISEVTYKKINSLLNKQEFKTFGIFLNHKGEFFYKNKKGDFFKKGNNFYFKTGIKKLYFDYVLPLVHGKGSEDGTIGAFFDTLNIPCIYSGILNSALLQDKIKFKEYLAFKNISQVDYVYITYNEYMDINFDLKRKIDKLTFPLIVKPNCLGSSIGVKKVYDISDLINALDKSFEYDNKVLIENCVQNLKEVNIAILGNNYKQFVSELETVSNKEDVLSYFDKYLQSKDRIIRIIPADINSDVKEEIINISKSVFQLFDCMGVVRFDYLIDQKSSKVYLNEANTIPGSLAYYLFEPLNIDCTHLIKQLIVLYEQKNKQEKRLLNDYHEGDKNKLLSKE